MIWNRDPLTEKLAMEYPVLLNVEEPSQQFNGRTFKPKNWNKRIRKADCFSNDLLVSSPVEIINAFKNEQYLAGLALVVSWGTMWRTAKSIYGRKDLDLIHNALDKCAYSISETKKINDAWDILTKELGWSSVITSKTLHFLSRARGFNKNPSVPIDNMAILQRIWPYFYKSIPENQKSELSGWKGNSLDAYLRYMTAILVWAEQKNWSTTQVEVTLFSHSCNI